MGALRLVCGLAAIAIAACGSEEFKPKTHVGSGGTGASTGLDASTSGAGGIQPTTDASSGASAAGGNSAGGSGGTGAAVSDSGDAHLAAGATGDAEGGSVALPVPIAHWEFTGNLLDSSGNGYDAEQHGTITYNVSTDVVGAIFTDGYARADSFAERFQATLDSFSIVLRLYVNAYDREEPLIGLSGDGDMVTTNKWMLKLCPGTSCLGAPSNAVIVDTEATDAGTNSYDNLGPLPPTGQWLDLAVIAQNDKIAYYVDGAIVSSSFYTPAQTSATQFYIGGLASQTASLNGILDDVRVYDVALSAEQVAAIVTP